MTGINAVQNNRLLHFDERERIRLAAAGDLAKQERLTKAACFEVECWAQYPEGSELYKTNFVSVAEMSALQPEWEWVRRQQAVGSFVYTPTQQFTDWIASSTGLASGSLQGKPLGPLPPPSTGCANGDVGCASGVGQQQNEPLSDAQKKARAEFFGNWSTEYQRSANLASMMGLRPVAVSYEIAAALTGLLEQAYGPSLGSVVVDSIFLDRSVQLVSDKTGVPRVFVEEVSERYVKPRLQFLKSEFDEVIK